VLITTNCAGVEVMDPAGLETTTVWEPAFDGVVDAMV
jgi:hypothetical protein